MDTRLRQIGLSSLADEGILLLNRAAEDAVKEATPIFVDAIKNMTFTDAKNIVLGQENAATNYLQSTTSVALYASFNPVIKNSLAKVGADKIWNQIITKYNGIPLVKKINPDIHTIRNKKIVAITQTITKDKYLVCFNKNVLGNNIPSQKTIVSNNHCILYKGHMVKAKNFIDKIENVKKVKYTGEILYNVLMEEADKMMVNNLICETLDPANGIAKLYTILSKLTLEEQLNKIKEWNEYVGGRDPLTPDKGRSRLHFS